MLALMKLDTPIPTPTPTPVVTTPPATEEPVVNAEWEVLVELIKACEATAIMQTHAKEVTITTKEGFVIKATEPEIDAVFAVYEKARETCGDIPIATE